MAIKPLYLCMCSITFSVLSLTENGLVGSWDFPVDASLDRQESEGVRAKLWDMGEFNLGVLVEQLFGNG